ncbi:conserved hypothetical protein [Theileria orientalis strain Shintoku]|uniref:RAP domain-containing protein n=1 Tax=Theileria orientalis strain Shintoku TaxID=869250 RepID=J7MGW0_THEOR|nr:conserved hypothetical protein [Theileria orientalis strain Shintoku]BAM42326.1 conserved hypothetical protein [Theileria orientalis strain Shintoku]|eukprot:XP_009692627.1 conserved hypothetical protein [Theileria orientalis strain Shintoku]
MMESNKMDSLVYRRLITNLTKCSIVRVDLRGLNGKLKWNPRRKYTTQIIAHSTHIPPKIEQEVEPSALYVNPICMQLDQLMYNCTNHEELLNLLVTHRGAMYLHNLVTVMKILRSYVEAEDKNEYRPDCDDLCLGYKKIFKRKAEKNEEEVDLSSFTKSEKEVVRKAESELAAHFQDPRNEEYVEASSHSRELRDAIIRDERYDLLLQDLYVNKNKLDVTSMCNVIMTLDALEHRYYRLYNGLLKRLLTTEMTFEDKPTSFLNKVGILLLKTCQCYARSGFNDVPLYNKVTRELIRNNLVTMMMSTEEDCEKRENKQQQELLVNIIRLYSQVKSYDYTVFSKISQSIEKVKLRPGELSCLAVMFSNHGNTTKMHDRVMYHIAERIGEDAESFKLSELCSCIGAFSKMKLYFGEAWRVCTERLIEAMEVSISGYEDVEIDVKTLCKAVHDITAVESTASGVQRLLDRVSLYLEQRIDEIDEGSAINIAVSAVIMHARINERVRVDEEKDVIHESPVAVTENVKTRSSSAYDKTSAAGNGTCGSSSTRVGDGDLEAHNIDNMSKLNNYLLSYVWRKIGTDVEWEREPLKVFAVWLYHMLVLPQFKHNISKRCIFPSFRQWLLVYNTRHEIRREVSNVTKNLYSKYKIYTKHDKVDSYKELLEAPVPVDMLVVDEKHGNKVINVVEGTVRNGNNRATGVDLVIKGILEHYGLEVHFIDAHQWMSMDETSRTAAVESIIRNRNG